MNKTQDWKKILEEADIYRKVDDFDIAGHNEYYAEIDFDKLVVFFRSLLAQHDKELVEKLENHKRGKKRDHVPSFYYRRGVDKSIELIKETYEK